MDNAIKDIIDKTLELEGLLLLAQSRAGSELEASVNRLVILKKEEVAKLIDAAFGSEPECEVEPQPIVMPIVEAATVEEITETMIDEMVSAGIDTTAFALAASLFLSIIGGATLRFIPFDTPPLNSYPAPYGDIVPSSNVSSTSYGVTSIPSALLIAIAVEYVEQPLAFAVLFESFELG